MEVRLAKKTTRKQAAKRGTSKKKTAAGVRRRTARKTTGRKATGRKATARKKAAPKKTAPRRTAKVAARKTAARAAATRKRKATPTPEPSALASAATTARGMIAGAVSAVTKRLPGRKAEPDAIELLEQEHRRFENLLKQGEETTERAKQGRRELLATLAADLNTHELMEEQVLYPALQSHPEAKDVVLEGYQEHHVADLIVDELQGVATDDEQWGAKFKVLKENIEHHIQEEEGTMFRLARGIFSRDELQDLAVRMRALKRS